MLVRAHDRCSTKTISKWQAEIISNNDSSGKGRSAHTAALERSFKDEADVLMGMKVVHMFWDIEKFFDSVDPEIMEQLWNLQ